MNWNLSHIEKLSFAIAIFILRNFFLSFNRELNEEIKEIKTRFKLINYTGGYTCHMTIGYNTPVSHALFSHARPDLFCSLTRNIYEFSRRKVNYL